MKSKAFFNAMIVVTSLWASSGQSQVTSSGSPTVAIAPVAGQPDQSQAASRQDTALLARTAAELIPDYIQKSLEKGLDRRVYFVPFSSATKEQEAAAVPNVVLYPTVAAIGSLGVRIGVGVSLRTTASAPLQKVGEEFVILAPDADFGALDTKLSEFGLKLAKRIADPNISTQGDTGSRMPRGIVRFNCVLSPEADSQLNSSARALTIGLPYRLDQAAQAKGLDLTVRGLELNACDQSVAQNSNDARIENFIWTAGLSRDPSMDNRITLTLRSRDTNIGGNYRPLPPVTIDNVEDPAALGETAEKLIDSFVQFYQKSQYRLFVHFDTDDVRKLLERKVLKVLTDNGYTVGGVDTLSTTNSHIDYFSPEDCRGASDIRQTLVPILGASTTNASTDAPQVAPPLSVTVPYIKLTTAQQRPATIGIWLSAKQSPSPPYVECAK